MDAPVVIHGRTDRRARAARRSHLLRVNGGHFRDACDLNHSFRVFSQVQEARGRIQQVADHLVVNLKTHKSQEVKILIHICGSQSSVGWAISGDSQDRWCTGSSPILAGGQDSKEETGSGGAAPGS